MLFKWRLLFAKTMSGVAEEYLIPYNLTQRAPETQNLSYSNAKCHLKPNKASIKYDLVFFERQPWLHTNISNKNMCKLAFKK